MSLGVFLVGMKAVTAAHQRSNDFHNLWFRRSYICLLYFCLCFTRAEVSHRQYLLWQHDFLTTVLPSLWGRRKQFGITVCCRSRPTAEHESCREKREEQLGKSALGGVSERLEAFSHPATLFQAERETLLFLLLLSAIKNFSRKEEMRTIQVLDICLLLWISKQKHTETMPQQETNGHFLLSVDNECYSKVPRYMRLIPFCKYLLSFTHRRLNKWRLNKSQVKWNV